MLNVRTGRSWYRLSLALAFSALLAFSAPANAEKRTPADKAAQANQVVSSDGVVPDTMAITLQGAKTMKATPFAGTGTLVNGGKEVAPKVNVENMIGINSVIGADGRYQVTATTSFPYRAIARITFTSGGSTYGCTGWMFGPDLLVTAGHCVYDNGAWSTNVRVYPGQNGASTPYGSCGYRRLYSVVGWTQNRDTNYDYGAVKLNCTIGNSTGWFGASWTSGSLTGQSTIVTGYPCDKPSGTMWQHADQVRVTLTYKLQYANDTYGCQSGAPVWQSGGYSIAIHTNGGSTYNSGTRITEAVFNNLIAWRNAA